MKRGGAGGGPAHSNFAHPPPPPPPPPPPQFSIFPIPPNAYGNLMPAIPDSSPRDPSFRRPVQGLMSQPQHSVNDHRNSSRRGNFVHQSPGDGSYHNNYGGRRDQDRGNFGNGRDAHVQPQRGPPPPPPPRGFVRPPPPPNPAAFIAPSHARPFPNHMGYPRPGESIYI